MICRTFMGTGTTLEKATKDAERKANEELKVLPNMEAVAISTNYFRGTVHRPSTREVYEFVITVLYQKKERRP